MDVLIGVDIGTTKLCAVSLDVETGSLVAVEDSRNGADIAGGSDAAEQDAACIVSQGKTLLSRLVNRQEMKDARVLAIGATGQMHGVTLVDDGGAPVTPLVTWQDRRGNRVCGATGRTYAEEMAQRLGDKSLCSAGCAPSTGFGGVTLLRMQEEDGISGTATALTIHDLFVRNLTGSAAIDPSDAASWGIYDVESGRGWLSHARQAIGLPHYVSLPDVRPTGSVAGMLTPEAAGEIGMPPGTPVAVAMGDNQASFLGSVPALDETLLLNLGTGGQMSVPVNDFVRSEGLDTRPLVEGQWLLVGASLCGGRAYQILADFFRLVGGQLFESESDSELYERMNRLAEAAEDSAGLTASTLFDGLRSDPSMRGSLGGITVDNLTPGNLIRAFIAGMVGELSDYYALAQLAGASPSLLAGSGNAIRRNPAVRRQIERQLGLSLRMPPHREEAAVGAALAGGVAAGVFEDWKEAGRLLFRAESDRSGYDGKDEED